MRLAIFDIDGTLTDTCAVDDRCYARAAAELFAVPLDQMTWEGTPHHTDWAILDWLSERHRQCRTTGDEVDRVRSRFVSILSETHGREPASFAPIPGAERVFDALRGAGWSVALATGGWGESARLKLSVAGIEHDDVPLGCSDDAQSRGAIVRIALARAEERYGGSFERVVSVGDRPWDVRTAAEVGLPFVGIGSGETAEDLRRAGATTIVRHYQPVAEFLAALDARTVS